MSHLKLASSFYHINHRKSFPVAWGVNNQGENARHYAYTYNNEFYWIIVLLPSYGANKSTLGELAHTMLSHCPLWSPLSLLLPLYPGVSIFFGLYSNVQYPREGPVEHTHFKGESLRSIFLNLTTATQYCLVGPVAIFFLMRHTKNSIIQSPSIIHPYKSYAHAMVTNKHTQTKDTTT